MADTPTFMSLSPAQCGKVYFPVRKNAETHLRIAAILEKNKEYSNAIAHLILGTEEFIKATVLLLECKGFSLRTMKKYSKLFYNHTARHTIIKDFFSFWMVARNLFLIEGRKPKENKVAYWINLLKDLTGTVLDSLDNHEWWKTADTRKQNCFYADYENDLLLPKSFELADYQEAKKHVDRFIYDTRIVLAVLLKANEQQLEGFRRTFWDTDFPEMLSETINQKSS